MDNGNAKIVQRHMEFNGGIAYGIDQLLEPPNLGSRCDEFLSIELKVSIYIFINNKTSIPPFLCCLPPVPHSHVLSIQCCTIQLHIQTVQEC